jgi:hypothetical protein
MRRTLMILIAGGLMSGAMAIAASRPALARGGIGGLSPYGISVGGVGGGFAGSPGVAQSFLGRPTSMNSSASALSYGHNLTGGQVGAYHGSAGMSGATMMGTATGGATRASRFLGSDERATGAGTGVPGGM